MHFGVTNQFSRILKLLRIFWFDQGVGAIGFLEAVELQVVAFQVSK